MGCAPFPAPTGDVTLPLTETHPPVLSSATTPALTQTLLVDSSPTPAGVQIDGPDATGPWLVIITPDSLWAIRANGTELSKVYDGHILAPQDASAMPAPTGGFAAFITGDSRLRGLTLNILTLPRALSLTIPLTAPEYGPQEDSSPSDPEMEAARAVVERTSFAWTSDGNQIAFLGMREGPSSDLYTFAMENFWSVNPEQVEAGIKRWTDGPSQAISPSWSPDGRYILHAGVNTLGTDAGYDMAGVWAVDTETGTVLDLYTPKESAAETFIGWQDEDTFLVHSWSPVCGNERLLSVDIPSGETHMIWEGAFNGVAFVPELGNGALLISVDQYSAHCQGSVGPGLFLLFGPDYPAPLVLLSEEVFLPVWDQVSQLFFARTTENVYAFRQDSLDVFSIIQLEAPAPVLPSASRWGERLAWALPSGVWVGALDGPPAHIFSSSASLPVWSPESETLFFVAQEGLYVAHSPDFAPQLVGEGVFGIGAFWVSP